MLLRPLRKDDPVIMPSGARAVVTESADTNGRVLVRYAQRPEWQPPANVAKGGAGSNGMHECRIKEDLLKFAARS